jgi:hypothetical protein
MIPSIVAAAAFATLTAADEVAWSGYAFIGSAFDSRNLLTIGQYASLEDIRRPCMIRSANVQSIVLTCCPQGSTDGRSTHTRSSGPSRAATTQDSSRTTYVSIKCTCANTADNETAFARRQALGRQGSQHKLLHRLSHHWHKSSI